MNNEHRVQGITLAMRRAPYQNNGATPWYSTLHLGTPGQPLKFSLDTGTNITWVTSSLCAADRCQHYSAGRFDCQASSSFTFTDCLQRPYSFGPWGTMQVESGADVLHIDQTPLPTQLLLAADYDGVQFRQLDWDGGIGLPSSSAYVDGRSAFVFQALMNSGKVDPTHPFIAFDWDAASRRGSSQLGGVDASKTRGPHLFLPWSLYNKVAGVEYIWSTPLTSYAVGGQVLATDLSFALDSGSSRFKGDDRLMRQTLACIAQGGSPDVVLGFADGEITLGANLYNVLIEEGPGKGKTLPQFEPLGLADLILVGALVMEHCYTVYEYRVVQCRPGAYSLAPAGVWLFNRPGGPQIITRSSSQPFDTAPRPLSHGKLSFNAEAPSRPMSAAGTWQNDYGSVMTLTLEGNRISGTYQSSTGSTGKYAVAGYQAPATNNAEQGLPIALAIEWHSLGDDPADPSWHWSSGLSGQMLRVKDQDRLALSHLLVATRDFPGLADQGTYVDKLLYHRVACEPQKPPVSTPTSTPDIADPLSGTWAAVDGSRLSLRVHASQHHAFGYVSGTLSASTGESEVSGFTDINARGNGLPLQSVSLTTTAREGDTALCLSGSVDLMDHSLTVLVMASSPTSVVHSYVQTQVKSLTFYRQDAQRILTRQRAECLPSLET
ncbi:avidin/streptavidin family protein [Pseudomonas orientalis]|uniref:Peptidase A1 pepsin n=1 Tax=Pseudomonas orientalis TaxID=76758 RepID=A0A4Q7CZI6_9PSED|nr:avidin/streptavidin family protein [Pseudomonas orientalis]RZI30918.1 peptidase A1 pepsin [Pseudomonas orientalis]